MEFKELKWYFIFMICLAGILMIGETAKSFSPMGRREFENKLSAIQKTVEKQEREIKSMQSLISDMKSEMLSLQSKMEK